MKNKNRFCVLDTNVLLRLITNDIPEQCVQVERLLKSADRIFFVSELVLSECFYVLQAQYEYTKSMALEALRDVLSLSRVDYDKAVIDPAIAFCMEHPALSFTDCYLKCFAENRGMTPVWTFDKKMAAQAKGVVKLVA